MWLCTFRKPSIILVKSVIDKKTSALALTLDLDVALFMLLGTGDLAASVDVSGLRAVRLDSRVALKDSPGAMTRQSRATAFLRYAVKTKMERERVPDETHGALPAVEIPVVLPTACPSLVHFATSSLMAPLLFPVRF